jgi:hypothetical protein
MWVRCRLEGAGTLLLQNDQMCVRCRVDRMVTLLLQNDQMWVRCRVEGWRPCCYKMTRCVDSIKKVNRRDRHTLLQRMTEKRYKNVSSIVLYNSELLYNSVRRELS